MQSAADENGPQELMQRLLAERFVSAPYDDGMQKLAYQLFVPDGKTPADLHRAQLQRIVAGVGEIWYAVDVARNGPARPGIALSPRPGAPALSRIVAFGETIDTRGKGFPALVEVQRALGVTGQGMVPEDIPHVEKMVKASPYRIADVLYAAEDGIFGPSGEKSPQDKHYEFAVRNEESLRMLFAADGTPEMWTPSQRELVRGAIEALHVVVGIMDVKMVGSDAAMILDELSQLGTPEALVARRRCGSARKALGVDGTKSGPARKRPATRMHRGREPGNNVEALFARLVAEGGLSLKQEGMADSQKVLYHLLMPFDTRVDELTPRQMSAIKAGVSAVFALGAFREIVALKEVRRPLFDPARVQTPEAAAKVQDALSTLRRVQRDLGIPLGYTRVDGDLQALRGDSRDRCKVADAVFVTGEGVYAAGESRPDQLGAAYAFAQRNDAALRILFCPPGGFAGEPDSWTLEERDKIREATVALADYFDNGNIPHHGGQFLGLTRAGAEKVVDAIADAQFANRWAVVGQGISDEALANLGRIASCQYLRQG